MDLAVFTIIFSLDTDHLVANQLTAMLDAMSFLERRGSWEIIVPS